MLVVMKNNATEAQVKAVIKEIEGMGYRGVPMPGAQRTAICIVGNTGPVDDSGLMILEGVKETVRVTKQYKLVSRETHPQPTTITVGDINIGAGKPVLMAGPCAVESEEQALTIARRVKKSGAEIFRGGAFKPRTSPFSFQGLERDALKMLAKVKSDLGIPVITEVVDIQNIGLIAKHADILQVGARNMQNFALLKELSKLRHPILLKRGLSATVTEWLTAADYLLAEGNRRIILCERGIRTFEDSIRFSVDISSIAVVKHFSHLPIIVDPSHAAGHFAYVPSISKAAIAAGADGLLIEVHPNPQEALIDGLQSLNIPNFERLMAELRPIAEAVGRYI